MKFKGQSEIVTAVLIFGVVVSLVGATYIWGVPLIKKQQAFGAEQRIEKFMIDLATKIENVDKGQTGSKDRMIITEDGILSVNEAQNIIEFTTRQAGTYYIISEEGQENWNPIAWGPQVYGIYGDDKPSIIRAKAFAKGDGYDIVYQIKFRELKTKDQNNRYLIAVRTIDTRNQNSGINGEQISIENKGRVLNSDLTETRIEVIIPR